MAEAPEPTDPVEDVKRKFREALERKRSESVARSVNGHGATTSKIVDTHGPAGTKRPFRRKSG